LGPMKFESPFAAALNHVLEAETWARDRLALFAGEALVVRAPPLPALSFIVGADGRLLPGGAGVAPQNRSPLVVTLGPGALAAALQGEEQLLRQVEVSGNARLAGEVMFLARHLRWDFEEELAAAFGDVAAHRLAGAARRLAAWHADTARRIAGSLVEYVTEEKPLLASRAEIEGLAAAQARLRDGLERLQKRVERLGG